MVGQDDPGLEGPVVMDGATDMTAEGGIEAASRSTLGLTGSSRESKTFGLSTEVIYNLCPRCNCNVFMTVVFVHLSNSVSP